MPASLWCDLDTCNVAPDQYRFVFSRVRKALIDIGVNEELEFHAYYTETTLTRPEIESLNRIDNLKLTPLPSEDGLLSRMVVDMGIWASGDDSNRLQSPYFLISGNGAFGYLLSSLRDLNFPIFIAHPNPPDVELVEAATRRWSWPNLSPI